MNCMNCTWHDNLRVKNISDSVTSVCKGNDFPTWMVSTFDFRQLNCDSHWTSVLNTSIAYCPFSLQPTPRLTILNNKEEGEKRRFGGARKERQNMKA